MATRSETIYLSPKEKEKLETVAKERFGTSDVPYGAVVHSLLTEYQNSDN